MLQILHSSENGRKDSSINKNTETFTTSMGQHIQIKSYAWQRNVQHTQTCIGLVTDKTQSKQNFWCNYFNTTSEQQARSSQVILKLYQA
jgi:hypothetical protein